MKFEWEMIGSYDERAYRAKVIGGWVVSDNNGMCFVPDPNHEWTIE